MGLLRTILFIAVVYYLIKLLGKYFLPSFLAKKMSQMANAHQSQQSDYINQQKRQEGKVTIQQAGSNKKRTSKDLGEYVDFEEIN